MLVATDCAIHHTPSSRSTEVQLLSIDAIDKTVEDRFVSLEPGSEQVAYQMFAPDGTPQPDLAWSAE